MSNVRVTHPDGSVQTFEDASFEVKKGGALKVREAGNPTRWFSPVGWSTVTETD